MLVCLVLLVVAMAFLFGKRKGPKRDDGPMALPIVGHLHLLAGYEVPYQAFTHLGRRYGQLVKLRLGSVPSLVVNGQKNIREILVTKGHLFDSRPSFERYRRLFCGNKDNSLAFCDWSEKQKTRRDMLRAFTFPRAFTPKFNTLETIISTETAKLNLNIASEIKPLILRTCANIFVAHFCSKTFPENHPGFVRAVENFDEIFHEINQGYAADFLPFLLPLHRNKLKQMKTLTHEIRAFILAEIIGDRYGDAIESCDDYLASLVRHVREKREPEMDWDTALFALEDIIGGHSAVGNYVVKVLGFLVKHRHVQERIQAEIDAIGGGVTISDRSRMPYTEAVLLEAIRLIASPIVPRVANQDTFIDGQEIKKDTMIFLNNYDLSMSPELWERPDDFEPERFLRNGRLVKPEHFLPFGGGRRGCMGYKMVQLTSFGLITSLLAAHDVLPVPGETYKVPVGLLALPKETFRFDFVKRS